MYLLMDQELQSKSPDPLPISDSTDTQLPPEGGDSDRADLSDSDRGNNKLKTIKKEPYLFKEKGDDLKILEICNEFRQKRFGLAPLKADEDHLRHVSSALINYSYDAVEMVAKHYFGKADCEYLNTYNAFNPSKMSNKLQRARDHAARNPLKGDYKDVPLEKLIED